MTGYDIKLGDCARAGVTDVTIGVTWGRGGFASDSYSARPASDMQRLAPVAKLIDGGGVHDGFRGKFVEIIFSQVSRRAAKPLKMMVGATGIEPVTPTMSR
jgi:hypothetical protein